MVHDDVRVEWIRRCVSAGFNLPDDSKCFDELLERGDGEEGDKMTRFLNSVQEQCPSCLLFFKTTREEEIEVETPVGKLE